MDTRKLSAKWVPKDLKTRIKTVNGASRLSNIWNFFGTIHMVSCRTRLVTLDETWLYYYDPETKRHSMEWRDSGSPRPTPKISECKHPLENFSPRFFGIKTASSSLIIYQRAKLSKRSITHLCCCNWRTFWRKNAAGRSPRWSCSCTTCPGSPGTCNPEETGLAGLPASWWPTQFSGSGTVGLSPVPWTEETIERWPFFFRHGGHCCCGELVGRTTVWIFFEWLAKIEQRAKKCIELRGEYVE